MDNNTVRWIKCSFTHKGILSNVRYEPGIYAIIGVAGIAANAMWILFIIAAFISRTNWKSRRK